MVISAIEINLHELYSCFEEIENLVQPDLPAHQKQVAYLGYRLADHLTLSKSRQQQIFEAGLVHDIGLISTGERVKWVDDRLYNVNNHAFMGAKLLLDIRILKHVSRVVKYHHIPYKFGLGIAYMEEEVPLASHILHLADRICVLIDKRKGIKDQIPGILSSIVQKKETVFNPQLVDAFLDLAQNERIWAELTGESPLDGAQMSQFAARSITMDDLVDVSRFISHIIDFRSTFTANHSTGVAKTASMLASLAGFPEDECRLMLIAGYLHDLGKLAVDISLLNKPAALTPEEYQVIKRHAFFTHRILVKVKGFTKISAWASLHHEKLNGKGYPFGLTGKDIPLGARIMAVADIFTAVTEDRPYRKGMNREEVINVFEYMVEDGSVCLNVVNLLLDNIDFINYVLTNSQKNAEVEYQNFRNAVT